MIYSLAVSICSLYFTLANIKVIQNFIKEKEYSAFVAPLSICMCVVIALLQKLSLENPTLYYTLYETTLMIIIAVLLLSIYFPKVIYTVYTCKCMYD